MDIRKLQRVVIDALEDVKAQNIRVFNTVGLSDMFDRVVLASGTSNRQTRALAYRVAQQVKEAGGHVVSVEGADVGEWVLVDLGDLVVHVMQPAIRDYYSLEEIWGGKPVRVKMAEAGAKRIAAHASGDGDAELAFDPADTPAPAPAAAHGSVGAVGDTVVTPPRKSVKKAPVKKAPVKKTSARKVPGKRPTAAAKTRAKPAKTGKATKKAATKPARKPAKRAPAKKTAARKTGAKSASKPASKAARKKARRA